MSGAAENATVLEHALVELARKTSVAPVMLVPSDVETLRRQVGASAEEYVLVACAFHFMNRIADLLHVDPDALPEGLRRFELVRRWGVRFAAGIMRGFDLENRRYDGDFESACRDLASVIADASPAGVETLCRGLRRRPQIVEAIRLALEERDQRSSLDRATLRRVHVAVAHSLPRSPADCEGFHERPEDPVEAFAFVGTRYPARTTSAMIQRLRAAGYDDVGILDLAIAVADANQWARMHRLLDLPSGIFDLGEARPPMVEML